MKYLLNYQYCFPITIAVLMITILVFDYNFGMLRDTSNANKRPFSLSKVHLAFWFIIIASSFISIIICIAGHDIPTFANSTLVLLGISTGTLTAGRLIDVSDQNNNLNRTQDDEGSNFLLDILSDADGISLHRFQCFVFNIVIGGWFIYETFNNLAVKGKIDINKIMPDITPNNLVLLGISAGTYIALKTNENKGQAPSVVPTSAIQTVPASVLTPATITPTVPANNNASTLTPPAIDDTALFILPAEG